jgi:hypothetical protein
MGWRVVEVSTVAITIGEPLLVPNGGAQGRAVRSIPGSAKLGMFDCSWEVA